MALELWLRNLHRQHSSEAFANIFASQVVVRIFALTALASEGIEGAGQHRFQALNMGATIHSADVVGKTKDAVGVSINTPLQGGLYRNTILF